MMYEKLNAFDKNNKKIIYNLLVLNGEVLIKGELLASRQGVKTGEMHTNFFTTMSNQIDLLLIYFINDEISASLHNRGPLLELQDELIKEHYKEEDYKRLKYAKADLFDLFVNRTDFIIGSNFLDFKVNTFSVFESYVDALYEELIATIPRSNKKEEQLVKLLEKYGKENEPDKKKNILAKIKNINFYVSSAEKINYVLSKFEIEKEELKKKRLLLDYYRSQRNTVHNLGVNKGKSQSVVVEDIEIKLDEGSPSYTADRNSAIHACRELIGIYEVMLQRVCGRRQTAYK